jgi:TolA-binding protein
MPADAAEASLMSPLDDTELADAAHEMDAPSAPGLMPLKVVALAALAGAVAAAMVFVMFGGVMSLAGREDPRLAQLASRSADLAQQIQTLSEKIRTLDTEHVAIAEAGDRLDGQLTSDRSDIAAIKTSLQQLTELNRLSRDEQAGVVAPALFGVALVQLRDSIAAGRAFDWELVNVRGIVGRDPALLAQLERLAPLAAGGVQTKAQLARGLDGLTLAENQANQSSVLSTGLAVVTRVLGTAPKSAPATANPQFLVRASVRLTAGDFGGAAQDLSALVGPNASSARPLIEALKSRAVAQNAIETLQKAARAELQTQLRSSVVPVAPQ